MMPSNHLILCHPLRFLTLIFPSIRVFSYESGGQSIESFSFSISPSSEYSSLISFRIDWFDLLRFYILDFIKGDLSCIHSVLGRELQNMKVLPLS